MLTFPVTTRIVAISPDGKRIAYVTQDPSRAKGDSRTDTPLFTRSGNVSALAGCDVWILERGSDQVTNITRARGSSWGPTWSPDGKRVAFYSDRDGQLALWVWEAHKGLRRLDGIRPHPAHGWELPVWSVDGVRLLSKGLPGKEPRSAEREQQAGGPSVRVFSSVDGTDRQSDKINANDPAMASARAELVEIDVASGRSQILARGHHPTWYRYSPNGSQLAFATIRGRLANRASLVYDVRTIDRRTGIERLVAGDVRLGFPATAISWAPRGEELALIGQVGTDGEGVWLLSVSGGAPRQFRAPDGVRVSPGLRAPLWTRDGRQVFVIGERTRSSDTVLELDVETTQMRILPVPAAKQAVALLTADGQSIHSEGHTIVARTFDAESKATGLLGIDTQSGASSILFEEDTAFASYGMLEQAALALDFAAERSTLAYTAEDATSGPSIKIAQVNTVSRENAVTLNPELEGYKLGDARLIDFRGQSGRSLKAALLLPMDYVPGARYPLIVHLYAARGSDNLNRFGLVSSGIGNMQLLATRGFAVLLPDMSERAGDPAGTLLDTIPNAVQAVVDLGIADPLRVGIIGHSYGAYTTVLLLTRTPMFAAAVARGGYYNTFSQYGRLSDDGTAVWSSILENGIGRGDHPWNARDAFLSQGPIFSLDRISTPLLLVHGGADDAASPSQSDELFVGLRRLGRTVEYAKYAGQEHFEGRWTVDNQVDYLERIIRWFERYLRPTAH